MYDSNDNNAYGGYVFKQGNNGQFMTKQASTLSPEEYARLSKQENVFSLALSETDVLRSICNHRNLEGTADTLVQEPDGTVKCWLCNYKFSPVDPSMTKDDVQDAVCLITDILQTIKMLFIDMPVSAQREFFQIIPLIEKVPQLFELAARNFSKHENYNAWGYNGANMNTMNMFSMLSNVLSGGGMGMMGGPNMGNPNMMNPNMQSYANMANPAFGAFGTPVGGMPMGGFPNPGMMGGPSGYNPQTTGFAYGSETEEERKRREEEAKKQAAGNVSATATFSA